MKKPNVLLIMADQHRGDTMGCMGHPAVETPNLDWLAAEGTLFRNAYTPCPSCVPARASLLTGMDPWHTGILGMGRGQGQFIDGYAHTLPGELSRAEYHTCAVGKMHFEPQRSLRGFHQTLLDEDGRQLDPGFVSDYQQWFDRNKTGDYGIVDHGVDWNSWISRPFHAPEFLHPTNWTAQTSLRFLQERDPQRPFFLMMSFCRPHSPYDPPAYYYDLYMNKQLPAAAIGDWAARHDVPRDAANHNAWRGRRSDEEIRRARAGYYGAVHHIDHQIGLVLNYLTRTRQMNDTLVIYLSDHGDMLGDHHLWRKTYAYEGSAHIPLIVRQPGRMGRPQRSIVDEPAVLQDIMPTILETAGLDIPSEVTGRSLLPLIGGEAADWREYVHGEHSTCYADEQETQYVTDGRMKYVWLPRLDEEQLFDLEADPGERRDVSGDPAYAGQLAQWRQRLVRELEPRANGMAEGGRLIGQQGKPYQVSPHYQRRLAYAGRHQE
ncbi:arylsulfatase [Paenibacillus sp. IB182496]|uniref:Arylsulfatase n=1 Tax=Paenibacillus sabuli TaxID=2772509 RepID=A0A927BQS1_9BACL|nr:arylsulfatase [Paenibacillus sabuli]MBD2843829.1 arylsulfatase [Paenibacillus sabuli]